MTTSGRKILLDGRYIVQVMQRRMTILQQESLRIQVETMVGHITNQVMQRQLITSEQKSLLELEMTY